MLTLIDSMVRVTIRHSESEPIASEAATALINRVRSNGRGYCLEAQPHAGQPDHGLIP